MFRVIAWVVAVILAVVTGNAISSAMGNGVVGFVLGIVCWVVLNWVFYPVGTVIDLLISEAGLRRRIGSSTGRSKYVDVDAIQREIARRREQERREKMQ